MLRIGTGEENSQMMSTESAKTGKAKDVSERWVKLQRWEQVSVYDKTFPV